jgi:hypothetical protein
MMFQPKWGVELIEQVSRFAFSTLLEGEKRGFMQHARVFEGHQFLNPFLSLSLSLSHLK